jgi:SP family general alpha glucoside:H+ symporter-like MFS transporter
MKGAICFLCIIYTFFRVPEPTGRTFAELDLLFEKGISARKFATTEVDVFGVPVHSSMASLAPKQNKVSELEKTA